MTDDRRGNLLVCDDLLFAMNSKWTLLGLYPADIVIASESALVNQLICIFNLETDINNPYRSLTLEVTIPGLAPHQMKIPESNLKLTSAAPGRTKMLFRQPMLMQQLMLRTGQIKARAIHESGEIAMTGPWIVLSPQSS